MSNTKATVAQVSLGDFTFDGLLMPNGEYRIGVSQVAHLNLVTPNNATKSVKALLGKDVKLLQTKSELNRSSVNTISISDFTNLLYKIAFKGNSVAQSMLLALADMSMTEVFNDAFGKETTARGRQAFIKTRLSGIVQRRSFTDSVKAYNEVTGSDITPNYAQLTNLTYLLLFGHTASELEVLCGKPVRDHLLPEQLHLLDAVENMASKLIEKQQVDPESAIRQAVELLR